MSICGGEPLEYPEIAALTRAILERGKHLFLCTDGTLIRRRLHMIPPYTNFFWNVKLDGTEAVHDARASRPGLFAEALDGVKAAKNAGFFVVVTTHDLSGHGCAAMWRRCIERLHAMHVDGYMLSATLSRSKSCAATAAQSFTQKMHQTISRSERAPGRL